MDILLDLFVPLLIALAIVTVVGHGIWVLLARISGGGRSRSVPIAPVMGRQACPRCGMPIEVGTGTCRVCGWPQKHGAATDDQAALAALREQVSRLARLGLLDAESHEKLSATLAEQDERLLALRRTDVRAAPVRSRPIGEETLPESPLESPMVELTSEDAESQAFPPTAAPASPSERVRRYVESRTAAAAAPLPEPPSSPAVRHREALSRLLASFMEERNIRWGELVGGLLIVGCSIALVISFWSEIADRPLLQFGLLGGVTAALFGVGLYTNRRWKLRTTSRGVLVIATLLVPLNFLAIAAFTQRTSPTDLPTLSGEALFLTAFAWLIWLAGRVLVPEAAALLAVGVMAPSLMQLVVRRFSDADTSIAGMYALAAVPIAVYLTTSIIVTRRHWANEDGILSEAQAHGVLRFIGLVSAAALMPLALLAYLASPIQETLHWLSPLGVLGGLPALLVGLLFWRRVEGSEAAGMQTTGVGVGVLGALAMVAAVGLAWPDPATLLPTALLTALVLAATALRCAVPAALVPAGLALAAAWLVAFHLATGSVGWTLDQYQPMSRALLSATSGHALVPLVLLLAAAAHTQRRMGRHDDGLMTALVAAITAAASLALVLWFGFARVGDTQNATWTLAFYALAALVAATRLDRPGLAWTGTALLLATLVQAVVYRYGAAWQLAQPWAVALLAHATIATLVVGVMVLRNQLTVTALRNVLQWSALATSLAAAAVIAGTLAATPTSTLAVYLTWLAVVWLGLAVMGSSPGLFTMSQTAVVLAVFAAVTAALELRPWYVDSTQPWLDPWFWQAQGIALAGYCLALGAIRALLAMSVGQHAVPGPDTRATNWTASAATLVDPPWPAVDRVVEVALVVLVVVVGVVAVAPGAAQELAPLDTAVVRDVPPIEQFQIAGIPHAHASGWGAWSLLAAVTVMLAAGLWRRGLTGGGVSEITDFEFWEDSTTWRPLALLLVAVAACPLLAAHWEGDVAVASALRWFTAGFFALASIAIWLRGGAWSLRDLLVAMVVITYAAMGGYVALAVLQVAGTPPIVGSLWPYVITFGVIAGIAALVLPRRAFAESHGTSRGLGLSPPMPFARDALLLIAAVPMAVLLLLMVAQALVQHPIVGPQPGSWLRQIGWGLSYGVPLAAIALVLVGYAIRDRSSHIAFAAGLLANVVATMAVMLWIGSAGRLDATAWIPVSQVNAIVAGAVAMAWLAAIAWHRRRGLSPFCSVAGPMRPKDQQNGDCPPHSDTPRTDSKPQAAVAWPPLLVTQVTFAAVLGAMFLVPATARLVFEPLPTTWTTAAGDALGWWAIALAIAAALGMTWQRGVSQNGMALVAAALVMIISLTATHWDSGDWWAYHVLVAGCCTAAWLVPPAAWAVNQAMGRTSEAVSAMVWSAPAVRLFAIAAVLLALRELLQMPVGPWWVVAALVAISARNVWIGWYEARSGSVWFAAVLFNLSVSIWWLETGSSLTATAGAGAVFEFLWINVLAAAAMAVVSAGIERLRNISSSGVALHRFAAWAIVATLLVTTTTGLLADLGGRSIAVSMPLAWAAWLAAAVAAVACWWDAGVRWPVACAYCVGLLAVGLYLDGLDFRAPMFHWALATAIAAYSLTTSYLWSRREAIRVTLACWSVPVAATAKPQAAAVWHEGGGHGWLVSANTLLGIGVVLLVTWAELTMEQFAHRMTAAYAIGAQALALAFLAVGTVRTRLQYTALLFGVLFAVAFGWAWLPPDFQAPWLHRLVVTVVALAVMLVVYGFALVKLFNRENEWTRAAARLVPALAASAAALFVVVLGLEVAMYFGRGDVPIAWPALVAIALALIGVAAAALVAALVPGRDPWGLSERGRTAYVYVAEGLAALLLVHIRVTMPWLFGGWFMQFWPLVVMAIAFVGVGLGELFHRRRNGVLSEPLQNTGALLPLLPALGFWFVTSDVDYSLLLLSVGVLYAALAVLRQSFLFGILAAVSANGSLWYLLFRRDGLGLLEHPQLWLIPPALSALVAAHINRHRLTHDQSTSVRYLSAIVIYVSSTADIFINGVATAPWLPAVLAGLSILGVLAGVILRVRAFLYLGTSFLAVALVTVIWYAAWEQQRTWIFWIAGIVTGVAIIALFGLFEKRRDDILRVVEQLKHWQA